jgi:D-3-phosphoglycerate dehydrogenase
MLIVENDDQPGVIGEVGTILGRHRVNIANFALGRGDRGAVGVVNVDEDAESPRALDQAMKDIRGVAAIREAWVVRLDAPK